MCEKKKEEEKKRIEKERRLTKKSRLLFRVRIIRLFQCDQDGIPSGIVENAIGRPDSHLPAGTEKL